MSRTRASAKAAGAKAERAVANWLAEELEDDRIDRRVKRGSQDRGDIGGARVIGGGRLVVEVKDTTRVELGSWIREAEVERGNDDAVAGIVVHKRRGHSSPADWYVTCTGRDLIALMTGMRPS